MSVTVKPKDMIAALDRVKPASGGMSRIRLVADGPELCVTADDGDLRISTLVVTDTPGDLDVVVPIGLMGKFMRAMADPVTLYANYKKLVMTHKSTGTTFTSSFDPTPDFDKNGFPVEAIRTRPDDCDEWHLAVGVLESIRRASHARTRDEARPVLCGIYVDPKGFIVATDSYRLAIFNHDPMDLAPDGLILPGVAVDAIPKGTHEALVSYSVVDRYLEIACDSGTTITCRPIAGEFPNWSGLIPSSYSVIAEVKTTEAKTAIRKVNILGDTIQPVRMTWTGGGFDLNVVSQDVASVHGHLDAKDGGSVNRDVRVAFDPRFLLAAFDVLNVSTVRIKIVDNLKPTVLSDPSGSRRYVIMPVRVS